MKQQARPTNNWNYDKGLRSFARANRKAMSKAEACLWKNLLSRKQLLGYAFLRQRPIDRYIADFFCKELMLVIEVDGITHQFEEVVESDKVRQEKLEAMGFTVLRFQDEEVLHDIGNVERTIVQFIERKFVR